jgi:pimeloyl-ACP methyl ester carboxylesterase
MTEDGLAYEDGVLTLNDGRELAWRWWGEPDGIPVLRLQGMPGSRVGRMPDPTVQLALGLRYLQADRPGYGGSTRKPGHGIADFADDLVALMDLHGIERLPVMGGSGGGPHALAIAARYPERVSAVTVIVGAAPLEPQEAAGLVGINAKAYVLKQQGWQPLFEFLSRESKRVLAEGIESELNDAPASDRAILGDASFRRISRIVNGEAFRQGAEGWADESYAMRGDWDFDPADIKASVTWWHGDDDKNASLSAARRAASRIPNVDFRVWHNEGHLAPYVHEREVLEELISRR